MSDYYDDKYELYVCSFKGGCRTLALFQADNDDEARVKAHKLMEESEKENDDPIYREYLYRGTAERREEILV